MAERPIAECSKCGRERKIVARGLCNSCYIVARRNGSLEGYGPLWCRKHASCVVCGKTDKPHASRGRCTRCYWSEIKARRPRPQPAPKPAPPPNPEPVKKPMVGCGCGSGMVVMVSPEVRAAVYGRRSG